MKEVILLSETGKKKKGGGTTHQSTLNINSTFIIYSSSLVSRQYMKKQGFYQPYMNNFHLATLNFLG